MPAVSDIAVAPVRLSVKTVFAKPDKLIVFNFKSAVGINLYNTFTVVV